MNTVEPLTFRSCWPSCGIHHITGACVATNAESVSLLARGGKGNIHFGDNYPFPPVQMDQFLMNGEIIELEE